MNTIIHVDFKTRLIRYKKPPKINLYQLFHSLSQVRRVARIFRGGGCVLKIKIQTCRGVRGNAPPGNLRNFEMPWTSFHAFAWWRKRERQCRVATHFFYKNNFIEQ